MDLKNLLGKLDIIEGTMKSAEKNPTGPKFTGQWKGTDKGLPGKKLVGDSILRDLSKGKTPKSKEQELAEEFQAFLEAEFRDTVDKRPARKNARPARGHEPEPRYKTVKTDEAVGQEYTVVIDRKGREKPVTGTMEELLGYFGYTLEVGKSYEHERGRYKINMNPKNVVQLVDALNKAASNGAANSAPSTYYSVGNGQLAESHYKWEVIGSDGKVKAVYHHNSPHYKDQTAASDIAYTLKSNPGTKIVATKDDQPFDWQGLLSEGWESGPEEYKEPYDDADDAYDRRRQEKLDIEAEKANAKRPQEKVYTLLGRGPNMEPNYKFPGEYKSQEAAMAAREKIMSDPSTPHPEHIGIHSYTRYLDQTDEAIDSDIVQPIGQDTFNRAGYNPLRDERDYLDKLRDLSNLSRKPGLDKAMKDQIIQRINDLNAEARKKGYIQAESRGHKIIATKLKDIERSKNFRVPSAEERQELAQRMKDFEAQLAAAKSKKKSKVDEYGADNVSPYGQPTQTVDPKQAQQAAASLNIQKTALNQLKQINPEIDPIKAATAMTKDPETMNPQEKEAAAQVAKTVSPALGSPAFGSLKTAIQKLQAKK